MIASKQIFIGLIISISLISLGWVLTAYSVPIWLWVGTLFVLFHLSKRGTGAIPLALIWSNCILWVSAFIYANPSTFEWKNGRHWALSLIGLWVGTTLITVLVAQIPRIFKLDRKRSNKIWIGIITLMTTSLGLGIVLYQLGQAPNVQ